MATRIAGRRPRGNTASPPVDTIEPSQWNWAFELPGVAGTPLCRLQLALERTPVGAGTQLELRAHVHSRMASAAQPPPPDFDRDPVRDIGLAAPVLAALIRSPRLRRLAAPLIHSDFDSWLNIRASTADLAAGAEALMPDAEPLRRLGINPAAHPELPTQTWIGRIGGSAPGHVQLSLLRLGAENLPTAVRELLHGRPFQLVGLLATVVTRPSRKRPG